MDQAASIQWPPVMRGLLQGVQDETGMGGAADPPAHDIAGVDVDDEGHTGKASQGRHIDEIGDPEPVWRWGIELAIDVIERARRRFVADRGANGLPSNDTLQAGLPHQSLHRASRNIEPCPLHLSPNLAHALDPKVLGKDPHDFRLVRLIALGTGRQLRAIPALSDMLMIGRWGDWQDSADRLDPVMPTMFVDKGDHRFSGRSSSAWAK